MKALKRGVTVHYQRFGLSDQSTLTLDGLDYDGRPFCLILREHELDIINEVWEEGEK